MKKLYMIGHSNLTWPVFAGLLSQHGIETLADVRSSPRSRFQPHFNIGAMQKALPPVHYLHLPDLGGKNPLSITVQRIALSRVLEDQSESVLCLMCSEGDFHECHRHYILAPLAIELGYEVHQIKKDGSTELDLGPTPATLHKMREFMPQ
jgi:uncharacterized protein (DUF488 family)